MLDEVPENVLEDILAYLKELKGKSKVAIDLSKDLKRIIAEDKQLLEKLAQ